VPLGPEESADISAAALAAPPLSQGADYAWPVGFRARAGWREDRTRTGRHLEGSERGIRTGDQNDGIKTGDQNDEHRFHRFTPKEEHLLVHWNLWNLWKLRNLCSPFFAMRDRGSLPCLSLRRARSARPRPSALGLHERSAADEADAAAAKPCPPRLVPGDGSFELLPAR
jgi:hypothetical protein